ncbi:DUF3558 family protein [Antribacter gilvus]|uniref:DUF3558 family protein n=1 Tax=Antribacter gilvus TaxID=2304675 RepID=UPI0013DF894A|nr:DUF3558 family protein [Antribacter gilvus]
MTASRTTSSLVAVLALLVLGSCSTGASPNASTDDSAAPSSAPATEVASPSASPVGAGPCDLLGAEAVAALAGVPLDTHQETTVGGLPACQWGTGAPGVQVSQAPASEWAKALPALIEQVRTSGALGPEDQQRLDDASALLASGEVDGASACELFSLTAEFSGYEPGVTTVVNYLPNKEEPQGITSQACLDGVYSSILLVDPEITADDATTTAARTALEALIAANA